MSNQERDDEIRRIIEHKKQLQRAFDSACADLIRSRAPILKSGVPSEIAAWLAVDAFQPSKRRAIELIKGEDYDEKAINHMLKSLARRFSTMQSEIKPNV